MSTIKTIFQNAFGEGWAWTLADKDLENMMSHGFQIVAMQYTPDLKQRVVTLQREATQDAPEPQTDFSKFDWRKLDMDELVYRAGVVFPWLAPVSLEDIAGLVRQLGDKTAFVPPLGGKNAQAAQAALQTSIPATTVEAHLVERVRILDDALADSLKARKRGAVQLSIALKALNEIIEATEDTIAESIARKAVIKIESGANEQ